MDTETELLIHKTNNTVMKNELRYLQWKNRPEETKNTLPPSVFHALQSQHDLRIIAETPEFSDKEPMFLKRSYE